VLPVARTFISLLAGIAQMPVGPFSLLTVAGSLPWTFALALAGDALAANWKGVSQAFTPLSVAVGVIVAGIACGPPAGSAAATSTPTRLDLNEA
jgi:membrane protein DedA with SNARE-associated domain